MNVFLCVPHGKESEIIKYGAKYHEFCESWYIDIDSFNVLKAAGYNGDLFLANIYAKSFHLAKSMTICPTCKIRTFVYGVIIDHGYILDHNLKLERVFDKTFVLDIEFFNWDLYKSTIIPHTHDGYRSAESSSSSIKRAITNHCHSCMHQFTDRNLFQPGHEFLPLSIENAELIQVTEFKTPIFIFGTELGIWLPQYDKMIKVTNEEFKQQLTNKDKGSKINFLSKFKSILSRFNSVK